MANNILPATLCKHLGVGIQTLNMYLDRGEYAHITKKRIKGRRIVLVGVTSDDIESLADHIFKRKRENRSFFFS